MYPKPFKKNNNHDEEQTFSLLQLELMKLIVSIRSKPNWRSKYVIPEIRNKWKKEIEDHFSTNFNFCPIVDSDCDDDFEELNALIDETKNKSPITPDQLSDFVFQELAVFDKLCIDDSNNPVIQPSMVIGTWETTLESQTFLQLSKQYLDSISIDYHPGSNQKVVNLIHPSMYPLINKISRDGYGIPIDFESNKVFSYTFSNQYQWLPSEFEIDHQGKSKIKSYINNLDVRHIQMYKELETIFDRFIPLFEKTLTDLIEPKPNHLKWEETDWYRYEEINKKVIQRLIIPGPPTKEHYQQEIESYMERLRSNAVSLKGKSIQVITKMANIVLTPESPEYDGGSWHIEGMENESIVATGIYYYDIENITESRLSFRKYVDNFFYQHNDFIGPKYVYGLEDHYDNNGPEEGVKFVLNQDIGNIECTKGKLITFPNLFQHKVEPFGLLDKTKPGHRNILVFFLIDPNIKITSTSRVPPQQYDSRLLTMTKLTNLKKDLASMVIKNSEGFVSLKEALDYRLDLMNERKVFVEKNTKKVFERPVVLCEH